MTLVKTAEGPIKTSSSQVTPSYNETLFCTFTLLPICTWSATNTFCPITQFSPITAPVPVRTITGRQITGRYTRKTETPQLNGAGLAIICSVAATLSPPLPSRVTVTASPGPPSPPSARAVSILAAYDLPACSLQKRSKQVVFGNLGIVWSGGNEAMDEDSGLGAVVARASLRTDGCLCPTGCTDDAAQRHRKAVNGRGHQ